MPEDDLVTIEVSRADVQHAANHLRVEASRYHGMCQHEASGEVDDLADRLLAALPEVAWEPPKELVDRWMEMFNIDVEDWQGEVDLLKRAHAAGITLTLRPPTSQDGGNQ